MDHKLEIAESVETPDVINPQLPIKLVKVKVLAENGIFKNGVQYDQGSIAEITESAANKFIAVSEVELINE